MLPTMLDIAGLRAGYSEGRFTPLDVVNEVLRRIGAYHDPAVWITRVDAEALRRAASALGDRPDGRPLWGIPFAVKDNIDCAGLPTTAGCPTYAYEPSADATVVARLKKAGALLVGKTNLDQFATGLNGTRSPHGAPRCVFNRNYISGGSSSGSAVAVAAGLVSFSLGTDTAGSGRVPAAFNNIVGIKPTRGLLSTRGVVPACRSLDCVSLLAATAGDGDVVRRVAEGFDEQDPWSRVVPPHHLLSREFRFGVLPEHEREFYGDAGAARSYEAAIERLAGLGGRPVVIDFAPFREAATLLYGGPFVAERLAALREFHATHHDALDPTVARILDAAGHYSAADLFAAMDQLQQLRRRADAQWGSMDLLLLPTVPTIYTVDAMRAEPIELNSRLGRYTNFVNLLDGCAVSVPAGFRDDGLPTGVTLVAPAGNDLSIVLIAAKLHAATGCGSGLDRHLAIPGEIGPVPADDRCVIAVVGAHLSGMPLNHELTSVGGTLLRCCRTAAEYRLFVLPDTTPRKPGLVRSPGSRGPGIELELWSLDAASFGRFVARIPAPLGIGRIRLDDGSEASGFLCEAHAVADAEEISAFGGWRAWINRT